MQLKELIKKLENQIPRSEALDWDNVGLLVGDREQQIHKVYLALDLTDAVLEHAIAAGADLILTHHPLIFGGIKHVSTDDFIGRRIIGLVQNHISYYAMHTNFDVCVMGNLAASYLELTDVEVLDVTSENDGVRGIGCVGELTQKMCVQDMAGMVRGRFGLSHVKVFGNPDTKVKRVALCPGSGKSEIALAKQKHADVYITGDMDHHSGIDAVADDLVIIDAGHYGVEHIYMDYMKEWLQEQTPDLTVMAEPFAEPFWIV